jgi:hypothetical protein
MAPQQLVYVHGAGPQKAAPVLKHELDMLLFGKDMSTTRVAHYANVRWPPTGGGPAIAAVGSGRARRTKAIRRATDPTLSSTVAADEIVTATLRGPSAGAGAAPGATPKDITQARKLVRQLYRRADRVASRSSVPTPGVALGLTFPDPIFRFIVGKFASDVIDYLYGPFKQQMQAAVFGALRKNPPPKVIVAHSLGTIILYDVLSDPALADLRDNLLVTVGCPLGIGNVQNRLRNGAARPHPVPPALKAWSNFADRWDPVALDQTLRDEFDPPRNFAKDEQVNNPARDNHELMGYLSVAIVHDTIVAAAR